MKGEQSTFPKFGWSLALCAGAVLLSSAVLLWADEVRMQNGDRYSGKIVSVSSNTVVMQSDVLGTVNLQRGQVAGMAIGAVPPPTAARAVVATNPPPPVIATATTNAASDLSAAI